MTTFYLDLVGGNDANAGTSFALRWKTFTSGATAARIAPGDVIRIMASPDETLVGNATWTNNSRTVTLAGAVTANISDCESAWTGSANVTTTADAATFKENTKSSKHVIATAFTTGKVAFVALGSAVDFSAYQQVSFWVFVTATLAASTLSLRLCSDVAGVTTVNTIAIPTVAALNTWVPMTVDTGGALGASIQSVALYADLDPGVQTIQLDNILACKASSSVDSLTLNSLIGKVWNLRWVASATHATNDIRIPTEANRNGFRYKVTAGGGGASSGSEPTWPQEVGLTVADGALTWTCEGLEDTWYSVQSINGTTIKLDNHCLALGNVTTGAYQGATETVATYKREPVALTTAMPAQSFNSIAESVVQDSGSVAGGDITFSGGWNRTDMSTQTGQTWLSGRCGNGSGVDVTGQTFLTITNFNTVRFLNGINATGSGIFTLNNCHHNNCQRGLNVSGRRIIGRNLVGNNCSAVGLDLGLGTTLLSVVAATGNGVGGTSPQVGVSFGIVKFRANYVAAKGNVAYGLYNASSAIADAVIANAATGNNGAAGAAINTYYGGLTLINFVSTSDAAVFSTPLTGVDGYTYSQKHGGVADAHLITTDGATIISATDQRHTASGISWKYRLTATSRDSHYPVSMPVAKIALASGVAKTISIWVYRDNANIKGQLRVAGGQLAGVGADVVVAAQPTINTWTQYSLAAITPTEAGVLEASFDCWDGVGTTNNLWIDDLAVA